MKKYLLLFLLCLPGFASFAHPNDAKVVAVYTLGQLPIPYGSPHIIQAKVANLGSNTLTDLQVSLDITGTSPFSDTKLVTILPGDTALISFNAFAPIVVNASLGNNLVTVSVPNDDENNNNSASYTQRINENSFSYADDSPVVNAIGFGSGEGLMLTRYTINGFLTITQVTVHLNTEAHVGNTIYGVVVDEFGSIIAQSDAYVTKAADLGKYKTFFINDPPTLRNTSFYAGLAQTTTGGQPYFPVSIQQEGPVARSGAYYYAGTDGSLPVETTTIGRLMIQASGVVPVNTWQNVDDIAIWNFTGANSPNDFAATTFHPQLSSSSLITRGPAASSCPGNNSFLSKGFQNDGISTSNDDYFQVTLSPQPGQIMSIYNASASVAGDPSFANTPGVLSQFAYSLDGSNFTLIGSPQTTIGSPRITGFYNFWNVPQLQHIRSGTTVTLRYYVSGQTNNGEWGFRSIPPEQLPGNTNGLVIRGIVSSNSIFTDPLPAGDPFYVLSDCSATASGSIGFTATGDFDISNTYTAELGLLRQISSTITLFTPLQAIGTLTSNANAGVVNFTIPAGTNGGGYAIRVNSSNPAVTGSLTEEIYIDAGYCHSEPTDMFRSVSSGNWNNPSTWETSKDGSTWIPASLAPDVNALTIEIRATHTVSIKTPASTRSAVVKGTLKLLNGSSNTGALTLYSPNRFILYSLKVADGGVFQVVSEDAFYSETIQYHDEDAAITVYGKIMIGDGGSQNAEGFYGFATAPNQRVYWYNNAVFEWNNNSSFVPAGDTNYFPNAAGHPIFRITKIGGAITSMSNTNINGFLEVNTPLNLAGAGIKTIADGIRGNSSITQVDGSGLLRISAPTTEVFAEGLNTQDIEIGLLSGNIQLNLNTTGLTLENGIAVSEDASVQINGPCLSKGKLAVRTNATLIASTGTVLNLQDADLLNEGHVQGDGNIHFTGPALSTISSPGTLTTPVKLITKQLQLGSNTNMSNLELMDTSNLTLGVYDLQLGAATLLADSANFIVTNDTGTISRTVDNNELIFPIGINTTSYTPAYISNTSSTSNIDVRVKQSVTDGAGVPVTEGNVDRSWLVGSNDPAANINLKLEWEDAAAQPQFERDYSYISLFTECQAIPNCTGGYYDAFTPQQANGVNRFVQTRTGLDLLTGKTCIVTSKPFVYTFTGNGDWNDAMNWTPGLVPSPTVKPGIQVVIDPIIGGQCSFTGDITVQPGGNITVKQGKSFEVIGHILLP